MAPGGRTAAAFDLCDKMYGALFSIWLDIQFKNAKPREREKTTRAINEIMAEYRRFHSELKTPRPLGSKDSVFDPPPQEAARAPTPRPTPQKHKSPFTKLEEKTLCKAIAGMALNLRELSTALGYSQATMGQWKRAGMPLVDWKITRHDALVWRKNAKIRSKE